MARQAREADQPGREARPDTRLTAAALELLAEVGWDGLTLERVAERAGISRVTAWRQGVTRESLVGALLDRLGEDFRDTLWPVLTAPGSGADRLRLGLERLCDVADRHLPLLMASDRVFHWGFRQEHGAAGVNFVDPFGRFLADGAADGSLRPFDDPPDERAEVVFNMVCWTYVHLRGAHDLPPERARALVLDIAFGGLASA